jgi:molybdopterin/thiamine biosynthesis adenylyltransferase
MTPVHAIDADQFDRQKRISGWDQDAISRLNVLVVGAGALGNEVVKGLAQIGVCKITLVDFDRIVKANLNRCVFFCPMDAANGLYKARVIATRARSINKKLVITPVLKKVEDLPEEFYPQFDYVFSCLDNLGARLHLNSHCYGKVPLIDGGTTGFFGKVQVVIAPSACLECAMSEQDYQFLWRKYSCVGAPLDFIDPKTPALSTTNSVVAALQVNEMIKLVHCAASLEGDPGRRHPKVVGKERQEGSNLEQAKWLFGNTLVGKYLFYDGVRNAQAAFTVERRQGCPVHG